MNGFDVDLTRRPRRPGRRHLDLDYFDALQWRWERKYPGKLNLQYAKWEQAHNLVFNEERDNWHKRGYADHYSKLYVNGLIDKSDLVEAYEKLDSRDRPSLSYAWSVARHLRPRENKTYGPV